MSDGSEQRPDLSNGLDGLTHMTLGELLDKDLPEPAWLIEDIVPEGATLLVAKPKVGKTFFAQNIALGIASGGPVFETVPVEQGRVLFLALEGSMRSAQSRYAKMWNGKARANFEPEEYLDISFEFRQLRDGGLKRLNRYIEHHGDVRLIVIDTFQCVRDDLQMGKLYAEDYKALKPLAELSDRTGVSIIVVHHANKKASEDEYVDAVDLVSGSTGLTGAVDNVLLLQREQFREREATLELISRDREGKKITFSFDGERNLWIPEGEAWEHAKTKPRQKVLDAVRRLHNQSNEPVGPKQIAEETGQSYDSVRQLVRKMHEQGELRKTDYGKYEAPSRGLPVLS